MSQEAKPRIILRRVPIDGGEATHTVQENIAEMVERQWTVIFPTIRGMRTHTVRAETEGADGQAIAAEQGWIASVQGALDVAIERLVVETRRIEREAEGKLQEELKRK